MINTYSPLLWYPIPGYDNNFQINALGTVRRFSTVKTKDGAKRIRKKKYLKSRLNQGYIEYRLCQEGMVKVVGQHRLLALTFLPRATMYKNEVNHINGIKSDNRIENLEWVTHTENMRHAHKLGLFKTLEKYRKPVKDNCTGEIFPSARKAAEHRGYGYSTIKNYLNGHRPNPTCLQYEGRL